MRLEEQVGDRDLGLLAERRRKFPLEEHLDAPNVNMVTCGGQATTPMVAAVSRVTRVPYAEMVSAVASKSAGPGTRQNIDEFTRTTRQALVEIGGAEIGKALTRGSFDGG